MTHPMPQPLPGPWQPAVKPCCGTVLVGEDCDCSDLLADIAAAPVIAFGRLRADGPVAVLPSHAPGLVAAVDPALRQVA